MLFVTNRALKQGPNSVEGRKINFALNDNQAQQSLYFCRRNGKNDYTELTSGPFLAELKKSSYEQMLILIHGFSNLPEPDIFPRAQALQQLLDGYRPGLALVVPLVWPCDNDAGIIKDYWDDQVAADASGYAFARALEKLRAWQALPDNVATPCLKRINVLAHSMGNRLFRHTMQVWTQELLRGQPPLLFRNSFLVAADIVNESLEPGKDAEAICHASRNVVVYYASDDLALRASKVSNLRNKVASRRLGHSGPEDMRKAARNVYRVDCDDLNTRYDAPKGHTYFLESDKGKPGKVFKHIASCLDTGRVEVDSSGEERSKIL